MHVLQRKKLSDSARVSCSRPDLPVWTESQLEPWPLITDVANTQRKWMLLPSKKEQPSVSFILVSPAFALAQVLSKQLLTKWERPPTAKGREEQAWSGCEAFRVPLHLQQPTPLSRGRLQGSMASLLCCGLCHKTQTAARLSSAASNSQASGVCSLLHRT